MFKVPTNRANPTFHQTEKIGFWSWLTSNKLQRSVWRALRDAATVARMNEQQAKAQAWHDRKMEERNG